MNISETLSNEWHTLEHSRIFLGTKYFGAAMLAFMVLLCILLLITLLLRRFFKRHPLVTRVHRILIYLLTMSGVFLLVVAGVLGLFLPIIPGIPLLLAGLLLMRRYHKSKWLEKKIAVFRRRVRNYRRRRQQYSAKH
jgi:hypothetical protein